jgi:predicted dehydrogenase
MDTSVAHAGFHFGASYVEVARFCEAVRHGAPAEVGVSDGLWSVAVGAAAHRSIAEGRPVMLSEFDVG